MTWRLWRLIKPWPRMCPACGDAMRKRKQIGIRGSTLAAWRCYDCGWDSYTERCENQESTCFVILHAKEGTP